ISASALVRIDATRRVTVMVSLDALAFALDDKPRNVSDAAMYELLDGSDEALTETLSAARERFEALFELLADGRRLAVEVVTFPDTIAVRAWQRDEGRRLPVRLGIEVRAPLPSGTRDVAVRLPDVLGEVILTVDRPEIEAFSLLLTPG